MALEGTLWRSYFDSGLENELAVEDFENQILNILPLKRLKISEGEFNLANGNYPITAEVKSFTGEINNLQIGMSISLTDCNNSKGFQFIFEIQKTMRTKNSNSIFNIKITPKFDASEQDLSECRKIVLYVLTQILTVEK